VKKYSEKIDLVGWVSTVVEEWAWSGSVLGGLVGVVQVWYVDLDTNNWLQLTYTICQL